jgi:hypothetical protein
VGDGVAGLLNISRFVFDLKLRVGARREDCADCSYAPGAGVLMFVIVKKSREGSVLKHAEGGRADWGRDCSGS